MLDTYKAVMKGDHITWIEDHPLKKIQEQEIEVLITVLYVTRTSGDTQQRRGERMAQCLEKIAQTGGVKGISDPCHWQREIRRDRELYPAEHDTA